MREQQTNQLYLPLTSTVVLKRQKETLYVPLDFGNGLTRDALVDSGVYVNATAQNVLDRIKEQAPNKFFKDHDPPKFRIQVANGLLEKPIARITLEFDVGDNTFAIHFVVIKNLTGPIVDVHFLRHNSVDIKTTHGLLNFLRSAMQVKNSASEICA